MSVTLAFDATRRNIRSIPKGAQAAGYTTGSSDIKWTADDWKTHPHAIRICQDHGSDTTADILDMETNAAVPKDCAVWAIKALANYRAGKRIGQRSPAIYASASRITEVVNALNAGHIHSGIGLWVAHWGLTQAQAVMNVANAAGPFPIIGMQFRNTTSNDLNIFSSEWLANVSAKDHINVSTTPSIPPGQWKDPKEWTWKQAIQLGIGQDNKLHAFVYDLSTGKWVKMAL